MCSATTGFQPWEPNCSRCLAIDPIGESPHPEPELSCDGVMAPKGAVLSRNQDEAVFVPVQQWLTSYRSKDFINKICRDTNTACHYLSRSVGTCYSRRTMSRVFCPHAGYYGKHLAAGGRHRHYEHHAGVGDRALRKLACAKRLAQRAPMCWPNSPLKP